MLPAQSFFCGQNGQNGQKSGGPVFVRFVRGVLDPLQRLEVLRMTRRVGGGRQSDPAGTQELCLRTSALDPEQDSKSSGSW